MKSFTKRATVYLQSDLHRAVRIKAAEVEKSVSELINEALKLSLAQDASDLAAFAQRKHEKSLPFEQVVKKLRRSGRI
jgi:hypothetical protein